MKRKLSLLLVLVLSLSLVVGCKGKGEVVEKEEKQEIEKKEEKEEKQEVEEKETSESFIEEDGKLVYLESENVPVDSPALKIIVDKDEKLVDFFPADEAGNVGVDYYRFNYETNEFEKYYYVSMMGTGHYYFYDLENNELLRVEDNEHNDSTQSTKDSGRWDGAVEKIEEEIENLENYFKESNDMTIKEFIEE